MFLPYITLESVIKQCARLRRHRIIWSNIARLRFRGRRRKGPSPAPAAGVICASVLEMNMPVPTAGTTAGQHADTAKHQCARKSDCLFSHLYISRHSISPRSKPLTRSSAVARFVAIGILWEYHRADNIINIWLMRLRRQRIAQENQQSI